MPNIHPKAVKVDEEDVVFFFAIRDILSEEELTYDHGTEDVTSNNVVKATRAPSSIGPAKRQNSFGAPVTTSSNAQGSVSSVIPSTTHAQHEPVPPAAVNCLSKSRCPDLCEPDLKNINAKSTNRVNSQEHAYFSDSIPTQVYPPNLTTAHGSEFESQSTKPYGSNNVLAESTDNTDLVPSKAHTQHTSQHLLPPFDLTTYSCPAVCEPTPVKIYAVTTNPVSSHDHAYSSDSFPTQVYPPNNTTAHGSKFESHAFKPYGSNNALADLTALVSSNAHVQHESQHLPPPYDLPTYRCHAVCEPTPVKIDANTTNPVNSQEHIYFSDSIPTQVYPTTLTTAHVSKIESHLPKPYESNNVPSVPPSAHSQHVPLYLAPSHESTVPRSTTPYQNVQSKGLLAASDYTLESSLHRPRTSSCSPLGNSEDTLKIALKALHEVESMDCIVEEPEYMDTDSSMTANCLVHDNGGGNLHESHKQFMPSTPPTYSTLRTPKRLRYRSPTPNRTPWKNRNYKAASTLQSLKEYHIYTMSLIAKLDSEGIDTKGLKPTMLEGIQQYASTVVHQPSVSDRDKEVILHILQDVTSKSALTHIDEKYVKQPWLLKSSDILVKRDGQLFCGVCCKTTDIYHSRRHLRTHKVPEEKINFVTSSTKEKIAEAKTCPNCLKSVLDINRHLNKCSKTEDKEAAKLTIKSELDCPKLSLWRANVMKFRCGNRELQGEYHRVSGYENEKLTPHLLLFGRRVIEAGDDPNKILNIRNEEEEREAFTTVSRFVSNCKVLYNIQPSSCLKYLLNVLAMVQSNNTFGEKKPLERPLSKLISHTKRANMMRSDKKKYDPENARQLIERVCKILSCDIHLQALESLHGSRVSQDGLAALLTELATTNFQRPGPFVNMTMTEYNEVETFPDDFLITVYKHKTAREGPAKIHIRPQAFYALQAYVNYHRLVTKQENVFVTYDGSRVSGPYLWILVNNHLLKCKTGFSKEEPFSCSRWRRAVSDLVRRSKPEQFKDTCEQLTHSERIATKWYKNNIASKTSSDAWKKIKKTVFKKIGETAEPITYEEAEDCDTTDIESDNDCSEESIEKFGGLMRDHQHYSAR